MYFTSTRYQPIATFFLAAAAGFTLLITAAIVGSLLVESLRFFARVPVGEFLFGLHWSPQTALRADQAASSGEFGAVPLLTGTLLITLIALLVAVPMGLMSAIYMAEYARPRTRAVAKPLVELLAGIPTVIYGYFALGTLSPWLAQAGARFGVPIAAESALAVGDDLPRGAARRAAGDYGCGAARLFPCHRRDDDRGDGGGSGREPDV